MKSNYKIRRLNSVGFTFIECLLALLILSLMLHASAICMQHYQQITMTQREDHTVEWHNFVILFEQELAQFELDTLTSNRLIVQTKGKQKTHATISLQQHKIYKTPGFQPYLYHVSHWHLAYDAPFLTIQVTFTNQQRFNATIYWEAQANYHE